MRWVSAPNAYGWLEHKLDLPEAASLDVAYVEFWGRILGAAIASVGHLDLRTIAFELRPKEYPDDEPGKITACFWDASNERYKQPVFVMTSEAFVALDEDQGDEEHDRDLLRLYLGQYGRLREVAAVEPVASLFRHAQSLQPLTVVAAVIDGWLDLQIGESGPGPLPEYDRKVLAGEPATMQADPGGLFGKEKGTA
jgi:hypothetical protein